jgi:DNA-binding MarR family transcriptional regulator
MSGKISKTEVTRFLDAWFAVRQFIQASNFNRFQRAGLSATQFMTLNLLPARGEGITMGELARRMNLKPATVAQTVDSLESRDMLERFRSPSDKRVVYVGITAAGAALQNAASTQFRNQVGRLLVQLEPDERGGLIAGLEGLVRAMTLERPGGRQKAVIDPGAPHRPLVRGGPRAAVREGRSRPQSPRR